MNVCICYIYICKKEGSFFKSCLTLHIYCVAFRVSSKVVSNSTLIIPAVVFRQVMKSQNLCSLILPSTIIIPIVRLAYRVTACGTKKMKGFVFYRWWIRNYCHIIRSIYNQQEDNCLIKNRIDTRYMYKISKCYIKKLSVDFFSKRLYSIYPYLLLRHLSIYCICKRKARYYLLHNNKIWKFLHSCKFSKQTVCFLLCSAVHLLFCTICRCTLVDSQPHRWCHVRVVRIVLYKTCRDLE